MTEFAWLALSGLGVGLMVGMTGVGGGSLMTPLLITAFGIPAPVAVGTDLACAAVTKTAATFAHRAARHDKGTRCRPARGRQRARGDRDALGPCEHQRHAARTDASDPAVAVAIAVH